MSILSRLTVDSWRDIDERWIESDRQGFDWRPLVALVTTSVALTLLYYYGGNEAFAKYFRHRWRSGNAGMESHMWSTAMHLGALVLVPLIGIVLMPGERLRDYLSSYGRLLRKLWLYVLVFAVVLPGILAESKTSIRFYPFEKLNQPKEASVAIWLGLYVLQFLAMEFFFRCFLLKALAPRFGSGAAFAMLVPYSMVLYGKPVSEVLIVGALACFVATAVLADARVLGAPRKSKGKNKGSKAKARPASASSEESRGLFLSWLHTLTLGNWRAIDEEWIEAPREKSFDWRPLIVLVTVCVSLLLQETYGDRGKFAQLFPERMASEYGVLQSFAWWSGWRVFGYVFLPIVAIMLMPGERVRDYFISFKNFLKHLWIYIGLFALVLPAVLIAAQSDSFLRTYPFYKLANRSAFDFWVWQALYGVQFLALEFFFRGFILKATAPRFGSGAIFIMIVPYCMIHFGKPMPETLGAIIAGAVLGSLALRTRSIWGGVLIHIGVALTMDLLALSNCPPADSGLQCPRH